MMDPSENHNMGCRVQSSKRDVKHDLGSWLDLSARPGGVFAGENDI